MTKTFISQSRLKELLDYDPDTGNFRWRMRRPGVSAAGLPAGSLNSRGYINIKVDGRIYSGHRLAWLWMHGSFPENQLDHINGVRHDNAIRNLRPATNAENHQNLRRAKGASGFIGVAQDSRSKMFSARIMAFGEYVYLGSFASAEAASAAYLAAKRVMHKFQPTVGEPIPYEITPAGRAALEAK